MAGDDRECPVLRHPDTRGPTGARSCSVSEVVCVLRCRGWVALAMTVSGSLVQVNGRQRSFQAAMKRSMAAMRSATVGKVPRRSACRVMMEKKASTRFGHDPEVGVKCK